VRTTTFHPPKQVNAKQVNVKQDNVKQDNVKLLKPAAAPSI
jgi:hypothetical protein